MVRPRSTVALATAAFALAGCSLLVSLDGYATGDAAPADGGRPSDGVESGVTAPDAGTFCDLHPRAALCTDVPTTSTPAGFATRIQGAGVQQIVSNSFVSAPYAMQVTIPALPTSVGAAWLEPEHELDVARDVRLTFTCQVLAELGLEGTAVASVDFKKDGVQSHFVNIEVHANSMLAVAEYEPGKFLAGDELVAFELNAWHTIDFRYTVATGTVDLTYDGRTLTVPKLPTPIKDPNSVQVSIGAYAGPDHGRFVSMYDDIAIETN